MPDDDKDHVLRRAFSWAIDHCAVQVSFGADFIVAGDPEVIASGRPIPREVLGEGLWSFVDLPGGRALAVASDQDADAPHLFITATSDGPLNEANIWPPISTDETEEHLVGSMSFPSGRFVAGHPRVVAEWGPAVAPRSSALAETTTGWDEPPPGRYIGLIAVARLPSPTVCDVVAIAAPSEPRMRGITIRFPKPGWAKTISWTAGHHP